MNKEQQHTHIKLEIRNVQIDINLKKQYIHMHILENIFTDTDM